MTSGVARTWFAASLALAWRPLHRRQALFRHGRDPGATGHASYEHSEFRWAPYGEASVALRYDDDKAALWELDARLRAGDLAAALT